MKTTNYKFLPPSKKKKNPPKNLGGVMHMFLTQLFKKLPSMFRVLFEQVPSFQDGSLLELSGSHYGV